MNWISLTSSVSLIVVTFAMLLAGMLLNVLVIKFGPTNYGLSALIYGPYSSGAGASGFMLLGLAIYFGACERWIKSSTLMIVGAALLYFSYEISLKMATAARADQIPSMVAEGFGCFPGHLTETLGDLDIELEDSVKLCSET